jgi:anti-sigma regulatory factor (Ser/Thr protein kinase)
MEIEQVMSTVTQVRDASQVGEARRAALALLRGQGRDETTCGNAAIVATDLATNLVRHGGGGQLAMRWLRGDAREGLELVASDRGPGMADVDRCLQDGYSTGGSPGTGLGAIRRLSSEFDIHSTPGKGTTVVSRMAVAPRAPGAPVRRLRWAVDCAPARGETECGDSWRVAVEGGRASLLVADGLGHGPSAAQASRAVTDAFDAAPFTPPARFLESTHRAIAGTRGAAVAMLQLDLATGAIRYAGVGNIAGSLVTDGVGRGLFSHNGTLGVQLRKAQEFDYQLAPGALLVLHSDGIQTRWTLDAYPGLARRDPALVAAVLARDFTRGNDDVTVLVARLEDGR